METINVKVNGIDKQYAKGVTYEQIAKEYQTESEELLVGVQNKGIIRELFVTADDGDDISFFNQNDRIGHKIYNRTFLLVVVKAIHDLHGGDFSKNVKCEFTVGKGLYFTATGDWKITEEFVQKLKVRMQEIIDADMPIVKKTIRKEEARKIFAERMMPDKDLLFKFRRSSTVNVYVLDDYIDYFYGYMLPSTGYLGVFNVVTYNGGFVLLVPGVNDKNKVKDFEPIENIFEALQELTGWTDKMRVHSVGGLNEAICEGRFNDIVLIQEALQERRIAEIASDIVSRKGVKFVMIAGPSSSGKTSFSYRLSIQLAAYGLKPHPIAVDDYFVNRVNTPRDADGKYNFECIEAVDTKQFNEDMIRLLNGERVELPSYNFKTGQREYKGNFKQLGEEDILVIEGIHCLNDKMSYELPTESKFKIYISALTSLNIDEHNRIPTTDWRLLRRMVRDARTRGNSAKKTIEMWPSVRKGEEENIFPYQSSVDATFNSALIYEMAVIKQFAEPLLLSIEPGEPEYFEAHRLLKFLDYFLGVTSENIPNNSLVREFVGGSVFPV